MADDLLNDKKKYPGIGWRWRFSAPDPPTRAGRVGRIRRPPRGPDARHHAGPGRSEEDGGGLPSFATSRALAFRNVFFAFTNWDFSLLMGGIYFLLASLISLRGRSTALRGSPSS
jgi:hypothetical protein